MRRKPKWLRYLAFRVQSRGFWRRLRRTLLFWVTHPRQMWLVARFRRKYRYLQRIAEAIDSFPADLEIFYKSVREAGNSVSIVFLRDDLRKMTGDQFLRWWYKYSGNDEYLSINLAPPEGGKIIG